MRRRGNSTLQVWHGFAYHIHTLWLFTYSDIKTIVLPKSLFGVLGGISGSALTQNTASTAEILCRTPSVVFWVWIVLLPFNIDNQRRPAAVEEDRTNRPWRPLPANRLTALDALAIQLVAHAMALLYSCIVGTLPHSLALIALGWLYNGAGAADRSCISRNAVNALGYLTFSTGAIRVAVGSHAPFTQRGLQWCILQAALVFSTVYAQDLPDLEGDAARGRATVPLVMGTRPARWLLALLVPAWSLAAAHFWDALLSLPAAPCMAIGFLVAYRLLTKTCLADDRFTFRIWNLWIVSLYALPLSGRMWA